MKSSLQQPPPHSDHHNLPVEQTSIRRAFKYVRFLVAYFLLRLIPGLSDQVMCLIYADSELSPELVIRAYHHGLYPSPHEKSGKVRWLNPSYRGIIPLESYHVARSLQRTIKSGKFEIRIDTAFEAVMRGCAERNSTWITNEVIATYTQLHQIGVAHSVEAWLDGELVGGAYGIAIGAFFSGESQFYRVRDAGKVAFVYMLEMLKTGGFVLFDIQMNSRYLRQFGSIAIPRAEYRRRLAHATIRRGRFVMMPSKLFG